MTQPPRQTPPLSDLARIVTHDDRPAHEYSICTLVTRPAQYAEMVASFRAAGFDGDDCEYLCIDNSAGNVFDAYAGCNRFLVEATGRYVILVHQDVELAYDDRAVLERRIAELDALDPNWAVLGNSGGTPEGLVATRISDPHEADRRWGTLPARSEGLDENFVLVRRDANLCLSHDIAGYHLYAADLCIMADIIGRSAWVVDFHLLHKSAGTFDPSFEEMKVRVADKFARAFRSRIIRTPSTFLMLTGATRTRAWHRARLRLREMVARRRPFRAG